jgi:hypothetical protein
VQVGVEGVGNAKKRVDPRRPPAALEASDRRLGGAYELGEIGLGKTSFLPAIRDLPGDLREQPALLGTGQPRTNSLHGLTHISIMLYIAIVRYKCSIAVAVYFVLLLVWVFWILDRQVFFGEPLGDWIVLSMLLAVHPAAGFAIGRWWALLLPFAVVFASLPLGYPSTNRGEPWPIWWGLLAWAPLAVALLALGVALRRLGPWQGGLGVR